MNNTVRIVYSRTLFRGMHIPKQECNYFKTEEGLPAIMVQWKGALFGHRQGAFVFARDSRTAARLSDDWARTQTRLFGFSNASQYGERAAAVSLIGGVLGSLVTGTVGALGAKTSNIKGFAVTYFNEQQNQGNFSVVADASTVEEILASISALKIRPDDDPEATRF